MASSQLASANEEILGAVHGITERREKPQLELAGLDAAAAARANHVGARPGKRVSIALSSAATISSMILISASQIPMFG